MKLLVREAETPLLFRNWELTDEEFYWFCQENPGYRFERRADKTISVMPPINLEYSVKENDLGTELNLYTRRKGGIAFNSQAGFTLPSGAVRCPDAAWLSAAKWEALPPAERLRFGRVVPEFVIEVRSPSEDVAQQLTKMEEWREAGVQLGWLLCPESERAWVFRAAPTPPQLYTGFDRELSGEDILPGFVLDLRLIKG